jgi:hypothetical protein
MLFMTIYTWDPAQRNEIVKRRFEIGLTISKEAKLIGEWIDLGGGRGFLLYETGDAKGMMEGTMRWGDLMSFEIVPVIQAEEVMKLAKSQVSKK